MQKQSLDLRVLSQMGLLTAIIIVMSFTPLGYIPLGFMNATTLHIPVILGACILGAKNGAILGGLFGITSVIKATIQPLITSFVFTPFYSLNEDFSGGFSSLIVAIVPRILVGFISGLVFSFIANRLKKQNLAFILAGIIGSLVNTIGVMGLIYLLFGEQYATAMGTASELLLTGILTVITVNGIPEAIIAAILVLSIGKILLIITKRTARK